MKIYMHEVRIGFDSVKDALGSQVIHDTGLWGTLFFIDLQPEANWAHPCVYLFDASEEGRTYFRRHEWPPCGSIMQRMVEVKEIFNVQVNWNIKF